MLVKTQKQLPPCIQTNVNTVRRAVFTEKHNVRFLLLYYWHGRQEREKKFTATQAVVQTRQCAVAKQAPLNLCRSRAGSAERRGAAGSGGGTGAQGGFLSPVRGAGTQGSRGHRLRSALPRAPLPAPPCPLRTGWAARGLGGERETSRSGTRRPHLPGPRRGSTGTSGQTGLGGGASAGHTTGAGPGLPRPATDTGGLEPSCPGSPAPRGP